MQFPVMTVTNDGKNLMSEAVQSGNKIKFEEIIISSKYIADTTPIEDMEALTYTWFTTGASTTIRGDVTKVTLQTDDAGKSFINISGEIFPNGAIVSVNAYTLAITARIGSGPITLFGISKTSGTKTILTFGASGTTKIHVSANISTASVGGNIIAYTFDSNYVTGDDFDILSQTLRSDVEVARRMDLANRHYYNNPIDAIRYSSPMNSFKLRSGLYPELLLNMKGDATPSNNTLEFIRLEHERYSLILGYGRDWPSGGDPKICVSGTFIKADGTVVEIQDRLDNLAPIEASTLYQDTSTADGTWVVVDILVSYDDTTLDTEVILEFDKGDDTKLAASINPRIGVMNWIKDVSLFNLTTSLGYLDVESEIVNGVTSYNFNLYKNATNKQDTSRFAYTWTDRELAPNTSFGHCAILDIVLFNNEPYLIMKRNDQVAALSFAVPHDLAHCQVIGDCTITLERDPYYWHKVVPRSNYLALESWVGGGGTYDLISPFKSVPDTGNYAITDQTVITAYGYKELDSDSEFVTTPSETTPNEDYTLLCKQRVDTDIKYVVCNGRLIPHID